MKAEALGPVIADIDGLELDQCDKEFLQHPQLGGLIFFSRNYADIQQLTDLVRSIRELRPELLLTVDQEGGRVQRFRSGFSTIPPMRVLGDIYHRDREAGVDLSQKLASLMAGELLACDVDLSFAPVCDLDRGQSAVIGDRSFTPDIPACVALVSAFIDGMNAVGMQATAKHFPGHGAVVEDSHLALPVDERSFDDIWAHDLVPFREVGKRCGAFMTAHVVFSQADSQPVSYSSYWIQRVLREKLEFDGIVFSDDLSMKGAAGVLEMNQRAETALAAGCNAVLICNARKEAERTVEYLERTHGSMASGLESLRHGNKTVTKPYLELDKLRDQVECGLLKFAGND